jgi:hypothetical protein
MSGKIFGSAPQLEFSLISAWACRENKEFICTRQSFAASQLAVSDLVCVCSWHYFWRTHNYAGLSPLPSTHALAAKFDIFSMAAHVGHMVHVRRLHLLGNLMISSNWVLAGPN